MDFSLPEDVRMIGDVVARFVADELIPLERLVIEREAARGMGHDPILPPEIEARLGARSRALGLWGIDVPEEFGGQGMGALVKGVVMQQLRYSIVPFTLPPTVPICTSWPKAAPARRSSGICCPIAAAKRNPALPCPRPVPAPTPPRSRLVRSAATANGF